MTATPTVAAPLPISAMQVQVRANTGRGQEMVFSVAVDATADDSFVHPVLDQMTRLVNREKLKAELADLREQLKIKQDRIFKGDVDKNIMKARHERSELDKVFSIGWVANNKRGEQRLTSKQQAAIVQHDAQVAMMVKMKVDLVNGIVIDQFKITCLEARIEGNPEPEPTPEYIEALDKIELPEDVGFSQSVAA